MLIITSFTYKYLIPINVHYGTGMISISFFDRDARKMLDLSASDLVNRMKKV